MKPFFLALVAFFLGLGNVVGFAYLRARQADSTTMPSSVTTSQPTFALAPPSQAVSGTLTVSSGHVQKLSRDDTEFKEASTGASILLGESVATNENSSATVGIENIVNMSIGPVGEVVFANMLPDTIVLQQKSGKIDYAVTRPISVRALHTLVTIAAGEVALNVIDTDMSITVKTGEVKFALVDTDNNTRVWNLKAGERANIDDEARQVYLVQT